MKKAVKFHVEKISNGYLFTETVDEVEIGKTFNDKKSNFFDVLKENETVGGMINDDKNVLLFEIIRHDIEMLSKEKNNHQLLEDIVQRDVFNPYGNKPIDEKELRLSITKQNCYSAERLKTIDFVELDNQLPMSNIRKAEICGIKSGTLYSSWSKIKIGEFNFSSIDVRIYMTVLAKYYEIVLGIRSSKKDELEKIKGELKLQIEELNILYKSNCLIDSKRVEPIMNALKKLIKVE